MYYSHVIGLVRLIVEQKRSDGAKVQYCITALTTIVRLRKRAATSDVTAHIFTPRIHVRITCEVRASLAGISALPKAHLAHVLLPRCKDMKILNNNICPKENDLLVSCSYE